MTNHIHLVFSQRPAGVSEDEYDAWYARHVREILAVPEFTAAQRFSLEAVPAHDGALPQTYGHLAMYEVAGTPDAAGAALTAMARAGGMVLPDWFGSIKFGAYNCFPRGGRVES
jgi:hypothetical protein